MLRLTLFSYRKLEVPVASLAISVVPARTLFDSTSLRHRVSGFQREDLQRADQAVQLGALGDLIAHEMREVIVYVRTDYGNLVKPLGRRWGSRLDEVADHLNHVGNVVGEA